MKKIVLATAICFLFSMQANAQEKVKNTQGMIVMSSDYLKDKIRGGWAGQTVGVTYGGPVEFKFNGTFIQDYQPIVWYDGYLKKTMTDNPGLYDDIYMDLTFVDVLERLGLDAPVDSFALAFANAGYRLWHANQAARYNILHHVMPPASGNWMHNPHADDIDFQIESDFAGLMSPGMPNAASVICDKVGHIMNYGDGWYGGVFVSAMYSYAFISDDIHYIINQALKKIPAQSDFYKCIADVIAWHKKYPADWHDTWFELQKKWSMDIGCPDGVFQAFNIDAKINAAYVVMGLLYGNGDFGKSIDIAARGGQDADCNPSTVGGILGAKLGYDKIPTYWKAGLKEIEDMDFKYTTMSLNRVYAISYKHALEMIRRNGGSVNDKEIRIKMEEPRTVPFEKSFEGIYPVAQLDTRGEITDGEKEISFTGTGIVIRGDAFKRNRTGADKSVEASFTVDGKDAGTFQFPSNFTTRRLELFWKYGLPNGKHTVRIKVSNAQDGYGLRIGEGIVYSDKPLADK